MQDAQIFSLVLELDGNPLFVNEVHLDRKARRLDLHLDFRAGTPFNHPITSQPSPAHATLRCRRTMTYLVVAYLDLKITRAFPI